MVLGTSTPGRDLRGPRRHSIIHASSRGLSAVMLASEKSGCTLLLALLGWLCKWQRRSGLPRLPESRTRCHHKLPTCLLAAGCCRDVPWRKSGYSVPGANDSAAHLSN